MALQILATFPIHSSIPEFVAYTGGKVEATEKDVIDNLSKEETDSYRYKEGLEKAAKDSKTKYEEGSFDGKAVKGVQIGEIVTLYADDGE